MSYLFGMGAKAPGVIYNIQDLATATAAALAARAADSGFGWAAIYDAGPPTPDPAVVGKWLDPGNPRLHPELATEIRAAGLRFGVVGRWADASGGRTNASTQDSVDTWAPDFLLYMGADDYWPGSRFSFDKLNIAAFVAANPTLPCALMTGAIMGAGRTGLPLWDPYGAAGGAWGNSNSPNIKARIQAFHDNGFDLLATLQFAGYHPSSSAELLAIANATFGWSADKVCAQYYLTPGFLPGWGSVADMAATGGQWCAEDRWPPNAYDYAWCEADRFVYGDAP